VRQLLNHTGGLPDYGGLPAYRAALQAHPTQPWRSDEFLAVISQQGLRFAPGKGWGYSNLGFLLLRLLLESITATSLGVVLREQLFAPLDLRQTFVAQSLVDAQRLTPGYSSSLSADGAIQDVRPLYHPGWVAHGVVASTAPELACIIDAIFAGPLLGPASRAAMLEPVRVPTTHPCFQQPSYGLGLMIDPRSRYGMLAGHGGGGPGYSAGAVHLPNVRGHRVTSVALANSDQDDLSLRIAFTLAMLLADTLGD
jgi:D-alanyl-D-alanine carboxypeptidase